MLESARKDARTLAPRPRSTPEPISLGGRGRPGWHWRVIVGGGVLLSLAGYTPVTGRPAGSPGPSDPDTAVGAAELHKVAVEAFAGAVGEFARNGGMLTDEFRSLYNGVSNLPGEHPYAPGHTEGFWTADIWRRITSKDVRMLPERTDPHPTAGDDKDVQLDEGYLMLQGARAILSTALGKLATAAPASAAPAPAVVNVWRGELYALEGYADVMLADLFCSGVPLNTFTGVPVTQGNIKAGNEEAFTYGAEVYAVALTKHRVVYHPSATTAQVYQAALAKFDTALSLAHDSARILNLARVGKGRVWLALGQYDSAAAAIAQVPQGFVYRLRSRMNLDVDGEELEFTVADRKGGNGLPYISSRDPRSWTGFMRGDKIIRNYLIPIKWWHWRDFSDPMNRTAGQDPSNDPRYFTGSMVYVPFTLASWEEAVLIKAEAALHKHAADPTWLHLLNQLRATAAPVPNTTQDSLWSPWVDTLNKLRGTVPHPAKLVPLRDPGTDRARITLLFAERGYWLFATGHRQGDLRRLVREYHWPQDQVYPTGPYIVPKEYFGQVGTYGTDVNMPIAPLERVNPDFHGCLDRGA